MTPADELRAAAEKLRTRMIMAVRYANPLADWLDSVAAQLDRTALPEWQDIAGRHALAIARAINGPA